MSDMSWRGFGVGGSQEITPDKITPNVRPVSERLKDWFSKKDKILTLYFAMAGLALFYPPVAPILPVPSGLLAWWALTRKSGVPLRVPTPEKKLKEMKRLGDSKDGFGTPSGILLLGRERYTGRELWLSNTDCREHFWVTGTTGSGKTEFLMGLMANALSWGSGFLMVDGKADMATPSKIYAMVRNSGRDDDFFLINFMSGGDSISNTSLLSNTTNPFSTYSSGEIIQLIQGLLGEGGDSGAGWQEKAITMMASVVPVKVWERDNRGVVLSINDIRNAMSIQELVKIGGSGTVLDERYKDVPEYLRSPVRAYLVDIGVQPNMLGDVEGEPEAIPGEVTTQHSYRTSFFTRPLSSLADGYRHIFGAQTGDLDMFDLVLNRRIAYFALPSLQKSTSEMANLGRIVFASLKTMMGKSLGDQFEGTYEKIVNSRATTSKSPYITIFDEASFYIGDGTAMIPAQGRSLGFMAVFAVQSIKGALARNQKEAGESIGTVNNKIYLRVEDVEETMEQAKKGGGEAYVSQTSNYERRAGEFSSSYIQGDNSGVSNRDRISPRDLRSQRNGEFHYVNGDIVLRGNSLYIDIDHLIKSGNALKMRLNHLVALMPVDEEMEDSEAVESRYVKALTGGGITSLIDASKVANDEFARLSKNLATFAANGAPPVEAAAASFHSLMSARMMNGGAVMRPGAPPALPGSAVPAAFKPRNRTAGAEGSSLTRAMEDAGHRINRGPGRGGLEPDEDPSVDPSARSWTSRSFEDDADPTAGAPVPLMRQRRTRDAVMRGAMALSPSQPSEDEILQAMRARTGEDPASEPMPVETVIAEVKARHVEENLERVVTTMADPTVAAPPLPPELPVLAPEPEPAPLPAVAGKPAPAAATPPEGTEENIKSIFMQMLGNSSAGNDAYNLDDE